VIADSFGPEATFMNALLLVRCEADRSTVVHNRELIELQGTDVQRTVLPTTEALVRTIHTAWGMPESIVRRALEGLSFNGDAWN
jgi:hypothetical protein